MASRSEILKAADARNPAGIHPVKTAFVALATVCRAAREWVESGQLGPVRSVEIGRHTGARC